MILLLKVLVMKVMKMILLLNVLVMKVMKNDSAAEGFGDEGDGKRFCC